MIKTGKHLLRKSLKRSLEKIEEKELHRQSRNILASLKVVLDEYHSTTTTSTSSSSSSSSSSISHSPIGIACYMNMDKGEVKTMEIIKHIFDERHIPHVQACVVSDTTPQSTTQSTTQSSPKYKVYLPRCSSTRETGQVNLRSNSNGSSRKHQDHLTLHHMKSFQDVLELQPQGKYGILEPAPVDSSELLSCFPPRDLQVIIVPGLGFNARQMGRIGHGKGYYDDYISRHVYYTKDTDGLVRKPLLIGVCLEEQLVEEEIPLEPHDYKMDYIIDGSGKIHKDIYI